MGANLCLVKKKKKNVSMEVRWNLCSLHFWGSEEVVKFGPFWSLNNTGNTPETTGRGTKISFYWRKKQAKQYNKNKTKPCSGRLSKIKTKIVVKRNLGMAVNKSKDLAPNIEKLPPKILRRIHGYYSAGTMEKFNNFFWIKQEELCSFISLFRKRSQIISSKISSFFAVTHFSVLSQRLSGCAAATKTNAEKYTAFPIIKGPVPESEHFVLIGSFPA